jgi:hypothetical protein
LHARHHYALSLQLVRKPEVDALSDEFRLSARRSMLWPPLDFVLGDSGFRDVAIVKEPLELAIGNGFHLRIDCRYPLHHGSEEVGNPYMLLS